MKWTIPEGKVITGEILIFEGTFIVAKVTRLEDAKAIVKAHNKRIKLND